jgi:hypothetical protein
MPVSTKQSLTVQNANGLMAIGELFASAMVQINDLSDQFQELTMGGTLEAFATTDLKADGSLADTGDSAPVAGHVIDPRVITDISRATMSAQDIESLLTGLQEVAKLLNGQAAAQQQQFPQLLMKLKGG